MSTTADQPPVTGEIAAPAPVTEQGPAPASTSSADRFMRRLLRLPEGRTSTAAEARSASGSSIADGVSISNR